MLNMRIINRFELWKIFNFSEKDTKIKIILQYLWTII